MHHTQRAGTSFTCDLQYLLNELRGHEIIERAGALRQDRELVRGPCGQPVLGNLNLASQTSHLCAPHPQTLLQCSGSASDQLDAVQRLAVTTCSPGLAGKLAFELRSCQVRTGAGQD